MRDRAYEREPLGQEVIKFLRYMTIAKDASPRTIDDYESVLARFATDFAHLPISAFEGGPAPSSCSTSSTSTSRICRRRRGGK